MTNPYLPSTRDVTQRRQSFVAQVSPVDVLHRLWLGQDAPGSARRHSTPRDAGARCPGQRSPSRPSDARPSRRRAQSARVARAPVRGRLHPRRWRGRKRRRDGTRSGPRVASPPGGGATSRGPPTRQYVGWTSPSRRETRTPPSVWRSSETSCSTRRVAEALYDTQMRTGGLNFPLER